ncbi:MAG: endonuclease V [Thiotrichales bacterium]|nr:MAG: endonuclease V [Thiotrichales bacterium]
MILAVDVHYENNTAVAAGVVFDHWEADAVSAIYVTHIDQVDDYVPGRFYQRELPCILQLLNRYRLAPDTIVIDAYVYLDGSATPGLGWYLYQALQRKVIITGVAKNPFKGITDEYEVYRGQSSRPLYVTCAGEQLSDAKKHVRVMSGAHRFPALLRQVDQISRAG